MRDDTVVIFQRISALQLEIRRYGPDSGRVVKLATYTLAIGGPDSTIQILADFLEPGKSEVAMVREAVWLSALALGVKIGIAEGSIEGAPGVKHVPPEEIPKLRKEAISLLERIPELDAQEAGYLRKLKLAGSMRFLEDMVRVRL